MWKDFFFFSGSQRAGLVVLTALILLALLVNYLMPRMVSQAPIVTDDALFSDEVRRFEASLQSIDSLRKAERQRFYADAFKSFPSRRTPSEGFASGDRFPFDPNTLDSAGLVSLGIPRFVVSNILRYRRKGGYFATAEKFGAVYGLSPELYASLESFVLIDNQKVTEAELEDVSAVKVMVELNSADSTQLMQIKGIGRGLARSILRFRKASGGFVSNDQLREVYGMTTEVYESIRAYCYTDSTTISKIKLNTASVDKLRSHPYLNFYQAKAIYELRRKKGKLRSIDELRHLQELDAPTIDKLKDYLSFE